MSSADDDDRDICSAREKIKHFPRCTRRKNAEGCTLQLHLILPLHTVCTLASRNTTAQEVYVLTHSPASCISCLQIKTFSALSLIPIQTHPPHTREGLSISLIVSAVLSLAERTLNRERRASLSPVPKSSRATRAVKALKVSQKKVGCNYHRPNYWKNSPWRRTNVSCRGRWSEPKAIFHWASQLWPQRTTKREIIQELMPSAFYLFALSAFQSRKLRPDSTAH
jgi:hypothetical protein